MNYLTRVGQRLAFRLMAFGILAHAFICICAIGMMFFFAVSVIDFAKDVGLTNKLIAEGKVVSVALVNREAWRRDPQTGRYLCYLAFPKEAKEMIPYLRKSPPDGLISLRIYVHPDLRNSAGGGRRVIEAPDNPRWKFVYRAVRGESLLGSILALCLTLAIWAGITYLAVRIYFFIKYGRRKRRRL